MRKLFTHTDTTVREVKLGNGSTKIFNLAMEFFEDADLVINLVVIATGVKTLQVITTDYTLSGGSGASGTVTMIVAPPATDNLVIERKQPGTQAIDYEPNSPIPAETIEEGLDRSAMLANQAKELADRAVVFPIDEGGSASDGELPVKSVRLGNVLSFNATTGKPETLIDGTSIISTAVDAAAAAVSAAAALVSELAAAVSAASVNLPTIAGGDAGKHLRVNTGETGYEFRTPAQILVDIGAQADLAVPSQAEAKAGTATTERVWTAERVSQGSSMPRSYLTELTLSIGDDTTNDINIAVGETRSAADDIDLKVTAAVGKQIDASFATGGTPAAPTGGLSSSLAPVVNDTWYHVILGLVSGTAEVGFDTSVTGTNLVTDHSFTNTRRIGSVRRGTAANLPFSQLGDDFLLDDPPLDVNTTTLGASATSFTLTTPAGLKTTALLNVKVGALNRSIYISSLDANDEAPSISAAPLSTTGLSSATDASQIGQRFILIRTNTTSQIRARADAASTVFRVATLGWVDRRGKDG